MWNLSYKNINIKIEPMIARVESADALDRLIKRDYKEVKQIVNLLKREYRKEYHKELQIGSRSLYVEILAHYVVQKITLKLQKIFGSNHFFKRILRSTEVIDCGERSCDNNRFIWDILALDPYRQKYSRIK